MPVADFQPVIGLEVHAQLLTRSKIFCGCSTRFGAEPNAHTCPVCLGLPGVLPVLNRKVVELTVRTGVALGCEIRRTSIWSRKNYFYPDLPKGYQVTQFDLPLCEHGKLAVDMGDAVKEIRIGRIHMEEDAGKNIHDQSVTQSLVDLNRAGTPLMEIVSEPDLRSAEEAAEYLRTLRDVLVYLEVNDGNLEEGSFRCDANVSVMRRGATTYGTRVELKNINSFRFVRQAVDFEIERQVELIEAGGTVVQETRLWDVQRSETRPMRSKEDAHDYRYFPEPDLPPLHVTDAQVETARASLPELPRAKLARFQTQYGLPATDARTLVSERAVADCFERVARHFPGDPKKLSNWFNGELARMMSEETTLGGVAALRFTPEQFAALLTLVDQGTLSGSAAKAVFAEMFRAGGDPRALAEGKGLLQVTDASQVEAIVDRVLAEHASEVETYRAGKKQVYGFLVGQAMKAMKGQGNPALVNALLKQKLGSPGS